MSPSNVTFAQPGVGYQRDHPAAAQMRIVDADAGVVVATLPRRKFAVCGFATSTRGDIPVDDPAWEVWTLNQLYRHIPRSDRHFEIHSYWREHNVVGTDHAGYLAAFPVPIYMAQREPAVPTSVAYPLARLLAAFGVDYFTSTVAFELALAIDEIDHAVAAQAAMEVDLSMEWFEHAYRDYTIGVFGVDMLVDGEYADERPCAEFWLGQALGRGITVQVPERSALLKQRFRYGYERGPAGELLQVDELAARAAQIKVFQQEWRDRYHMALGGAQALEALGPHASPSTRTQRLKQAEASAQEALVQVRQLDGALAENTAVADLLKHRLRGGTVALTGTAPPCLVDGQEVLD